MNYKFRKNQVILQGDTHSSEATYAFLRDDVSSGSDYVHLGDVGLGFGDMSYSVSNANSYLQRYSKLCVEKDIISYLIRGNHDNPDVWKLDNHPNVILIQDGDIATFPNGKRVLFLGGGISVDRCVRRIDFSYWVNEYTTPLKTVENADIVFSHDAPEQFNHSTDTLWVHFDWAIKKDPELLEDCYKQRKLVGDLVAMSGATVIYNGHFHNSLREEKDGVFCRCLNIDELFEFDADGTHSL